MAKAVKTNAMRLLEAEGIPFHTMEYEVDESDLSGAHVVAQLGLDKDQVFKTLVARGEKKGILVFCIPVCEELDLKKAATAAGDKRVEMIHVKELQGLTGYIRGGCSPLGAKKEYPVYLDASARQWDIIAISAGKRGEQIMLAPQDLVQAVKAVVAELQKY